MPGDDQEKKLDDAADSTAESPGDELLTGEVESGRKEWTDKEKEKQAEQRKRSGITSDFGKPVIADDKAVMGGGQLRKRPGSTADDGIVTVDDKGEKTTRWPNGNLRVDHPDKSFRLVERLPGDALRETHGGSDRPEENFILLRDKNGKYKLDDGTGVGLPSLESIKPVDESQAPAHRKLDRLAGEKISDPERLAKFRADMLRFEARMKSLRQDGLPGLEIQATYEQVGRLLKAEGNEPLTPEQRIVLAQQVLSQAASPKSVDQGQQSTCNVATIESRLYTQDPTRAAQMVADVALTGKFKGHNDVEVSINPNSLQPDGGASRNPPFDGARSHASQIFQVTAVNMSYQMKKAQGSWEGNYVYEQYFPGQTDGTGKKVGRVPGDSGERLIDYSKTPPEERKEFSTQKPIRRPGLSDDDIIKVVGAITDERVFDQILIGHKVNAQDNRLSTKIDSEEQLNAALLVAARDNKLPIIVSVSSRMEPFWSDSDGQLAAGSAGAHVITITGYDAGPPARVGIDNQWGSHSDHSSDLQHMVPVHELYLAMAYPFEAEDKGSADKVVQAVKADIDAGKATTSQRLEYLRLTSNNPGSGEYRDTLMQCMLDEQKRFSTLKEGTSAVDHERAMRTFRLMLRRLDRVDQADVVNRLLQDSPSDPDLLAERDRIKDMPLGGTIMR